VYEVEKDQKVKLASLEFLDYAMQWWHQSVMDIGLNKMPTVVSWYDLKECMRARFVPPHYKKELLLKLQRLHQGPRTVDEYFKDLETTLTKINMHDSEKSKITRFVSGLRREIQDIVELYEYFSLKKVVHLAIKVESQLLKNFFFKNTHNDGFYKSSWKDTNKIARKTLPSKFSKETTSDHRVSKTISTPKSLTKSSSRKCFKCLGFRHRDVNCPNKRTMMIKEVNKDQIKMKQKNKTEKDDENNKTGLITSPNVVKTIMLIRPKIKIVGLLWYFPSFSYLSINSSITCNIC